MRKRNSNKIAWSTLVQILGLKVQARPATVQFKAGPIIILFIFYMLRGLVRYEFQTLKFALKFVLLRWICFNEATWLKMKRKIVD